jgi:hypothetical protein
MKKLLLVSMLALAAGQAEAARPDFWNGGQWTCTIDGSQTKLFVRFDIAKHGKGDHSKATLQDPPYYQKTKFHRIDLVSLKDTRVKFVVRAQTSDARVTLFKGSDTDRIARGTIRLKGKEFRVDCSHA